MVDLDAQATLSPHASMAAPTRRMDEVTPEAVQCTCRQDAQRAGVSPLAGTCEMGRLALRREVTQDDERFIAEASPAEILKMQQKLVVVRGDRLEGGAPWDT